MAQMCPSIPDFDAPDSERKVFEILRENLPDRYLVMHSRRIFQTAVANRRAEEREADFVVLDHHDWRTLFYQPGMPPVRRVVVAGQDAFVAAGRV